MLCVCVGGGGLNQTILRHTFLMRYIETVLYMYILLYIYLSFAKDEKRRMVLYSVGYLFSEECNQMERDPFKLHDVLLGVSLSYRYCNLRSITLSP